MDSVSALCAFNDFFSFSEKYFDMNKKLARDALDIYKKFLIRMDRVADFLKVAEVRLSKKKSESSNIFPKIISYGNKRHTFFAKTHSRNYHILKILR